MTVMEAIGLIDKLRPNRYDQDMKIRWLSVLDGIIKVEIIDAHEGGGAVEYTGYDSSDLTHELLVPSPYDDIYVKWLEAQIDYANREYQKYNNSINMYNNAFMAYAKAYTREHMPKSASFKNF